MKQLRIKNFGPIREAALDIDRIAVIIGMQSSGKSSLLKMACYCSWVEKRIQLTQSDKLFQGPDAFRDFFVYYYGLKDYFRLDTVVEYSSPYISFSYGENGFFFSWSPRHWGFRRPKVQYIPSERNIASFIPNWMNIPARDGFLEFLSEWDSARKTLPKEENILQLDISYAYDKVRDTNTIITTEGTSLPLSDSSSGLQSLIPLYLLIDYLHTEQDNTMVAKKEFTLEQRIEREKLISTIYNKVRKGDEYEPTEINLEGKTFSFPNPKAATRFMNRCTRYLYTDHCELFLEEPEQNLYPPTQSQLVDWLWEKTYNSKRKHTLLVNTHSPYILNEFCKLYCEGMDLYVTYPDKENPTFHNLKKITDEEVNEIYINGVDLFFNSAAYV